jgi:hypothetical protein
VRCRPRVCSGGMPGWHCSTPARRAYAAAGGGVQDGLADDARRRQRRRDECVYASSENSYRSAFPHRRSSS